MKNSIHFFLSGSGGAGVTSLTFTFSEIYGGSVADLDLFRRKLSSFPVRSIDMGISQSGAILSCEKQEAAVFQLFEKLFEKAEADEDFPPIFIDVSSSSVGVLFEFLKGGTGEMLAKMLSSKDGGLYGHYVINSLDPRGSYWGATTASRIFTECGGKFSALFNEFYVSLKGKEEDEEGEEMDVAHGDVHIKTENLLRKKIGEGFIGTIVTPTPSPSQRELLTRKIFGPRMSFNDLVSEEKNSSTLLERTLVLGYLNQVKSAWEDVVCSTKTTDENDVNSDSKKDTADKEGAAAKKEVMGTGESGEHSEGNESSSDAGGYEYE